MGEVGGRTLAVELLAARFLFAIGARPIAAVIASSTRPPPLERMRRCRSAGPRTSAEGCRWARRMDPERRQRAESLPWSEGNAFETSRKRTRSPPCNRTSVRSCARVTSERRLSGPMPQGERRAACGARRNSTSTLMTLARTAAAAAAAAAVMVVVVEGGGEDPTCAAPSRSTPTLRVWQSKCRTTSSFCQYEECDDALFSASKEVNFHVFEGSRTSHTGLALWMPWWLRMKAATSSVDAPCGRLLAAGRVALRSRGRGGAHRGMRLDRCH